MKTNFKTCLKQIIFMFFPIRFLKRGYHTHKYRIIMCDTIYDTKRSKLICGRDFFLYSVAFWIGRNGGYFITVKHFIGKVFLIPLDYLPNPTDSLKFYLKKYNMVSDYERLFCFDLKDV